MGFQCRLHMQVLVCTEQADWRPGQGLVTLSLQTETSVRLLCPSPVVAQASSNCQLAIFGRRCKHDEARRGRQKPLCRNPASAESCCQGFSS